ncbi:hypothetical protein G1C95_1001 [Bifidobacterium sp. DSM 109957]|uniref:Uncharacterized protein n=2 Tax=Bifidobacterium oedipodis TaxID=2675322 RepID=A0A7Y0HTL3_9BIFI|nr:hypothetical protein [Bifidobacterium sp. DSM 109957]
MHSPDLLYMTDDVLPGEVVLRTPEAIQAYFGRLLSEAET